MNTSWQKFVSSWDASCEKRVLYLPPRFPAGTEALLLAGLFICLVRRPVCLAGSPLRC